MTVLIDALRDIVVEICQEMARRGHAVRFIDEREDPQERMVVEKWELGAGCVSLALNHKHEPHLFVIFHDKTRVRMLFLQVIPGPEPGFRRYQSTVMDSKLVGEEDEFWNAALPWNDAGMRINKGEKFSLFEMIAVMHEYALACKP